MAKSTEPREVAELGRPETPEETAARKAEQSRLYRDRKTLRNLLYALLVSVGLVAAIIIVVPRPEQSMLADVDYRQVAVSAQASMPVPLAVPDLPAEWTSNAAELRSGTADGVVSWYIGLISPTDQYVGLSQAIDANPTWLADQVARGLASGVVTLDGVEWTVYDNRARTTDEVGNAEYALTAESGASTYVVFGSADPDEIEQVATAIAANVLEQPEEASR
ncbi:DUF4245 domain-containing protein [Herbiconiux liangxiaofengii]|uniref:DUF4245 domain-containing protein n=1 Tax=Herbiconiux liangxiaofengii TaxID=3342795 RepID=UPI0035BA11E2